MTLEQSLGCFCIPLFLIFHSGIGVRPQPSTCAGRRGIGLDFFRWLPCHVLRRSGSLGHLQALHGEFGFVQGGSNLVEAHLDESALIHDGGSRLLEGDADFFGVVFDSSLGRA